MCRTRSADFLLDRLAAFGPHLPFKLLMTSMPKAGTHLMMEALRHIPAIARTPLLLRPRVPVADYEAPLARLARNRYACGHIGCNEYTSLLASRFQLSVLVMLRDPRDIVISHVDHAYRLQPSMLKAFYRSLPDAKARYRAAILGVPREHYRYVDAVGGSRGYEMLTGYADIGTVCRSYLSWMTTKSVRVDVVHFRDLVGLDGGGTRELQEASVRRIFRFLGIDASCEDVSRVCHAAYNTRSSTFNKGNQGRWREAFDDELKDLFKAVAGQELITMGYESDDRW